MTRITSEQLTMVAKPYHGNSKIIERLFKGVDTGDCIKKKEKVAQQED